MTKTEEEALETTTADAETSAEGDAYPDDSGGDGGGSLKEEEEEKIEEDEIEDRLAERSDKPSEDERGDVKGTPDAGLTSSVSRENNNQYATSSSKRGTIVEIPDENNVDEGATATAEIPHENIGGYPAVFNNGEDDEIQEVEPGFMFIAGPFYTGTGIHTGYNSGPDDDGDINEESVMVEGFLPEDDPTRRSNEQRTRDRVQERVQRLIDNAITLEDSAVVPIPMEEDGDEEESNGLDAARSNSLRNDDEVEKSDNCRWLLPLGLVLAACIILAVALPLSMQGRSEDAAQDTTVSSVCLPGEVDVRYELAKSILSSITSLDLLEDDSTPQGKAIQWIVCYDSISVELLENQDPSTGKLPKQKHGFSIGGDSGEAHLTRRYILASFFFSTTQANPWKDSLNFMSPDLHECNWYKNYSRPNFPFGELSEYDPVGVFCVDNSDGDIVFDDYQKPIDSLLINIRILNDLNGPLPPELGYLIDCDTMYLESNIGLVGQLPQTMGNMTRLKNLSLLFNGPKFGGELPSSLFQLKKLLSIHIQYNFGTNWSLPSDVEAIDDTQLDRLVLANNFVGTIPSWIAKLKQLQTLDLATNKFHGAIPEAIGDLSSLKYLNLRGNNLTETIPSSLGNLTAIEVLNLGNNALHGELPASIGNLRALQLLDVGSNEMTSTIPSSFGNLESLKYLVLESNRFNGTVDVLKATKNLARLLIRSNSFSGSLPDGLFSGTSENVVVDIGDNKFADKLPASFANMSNLVSLIGTKNTFADDATSEAVCDNTTVLVMDCDACECCEVCCDGGENDAVCDFKLDVPAVMGYDCGSWFQICMQGKDDFSQNIGY